ncbi:MAG TPA: acyl-CoA dehydrogenase family protein [Acidimicrobiales bacterium]|nr:acyl-CoA dehydrogenase family protein [Acidimicrobiales bacterium]
MVDTGTRISSLEDALEAVSRVGPVAREWAQKAEDSRALPAEVVDAIGDAGLWGVFVPEELGGAGLVGLSETFEIIRALAYEDTSAAWGVLICAGTGGILGAKLPPEGRAEVFADGLVPTAGVFNPGGGATPAEGGGVVVNGRWPFGSGVGYCRWVLANALRLDESGAPRPGSNGLPDIVATVVRSDEVTVVDDWFVAGLRGTGSMTFTMSNVTVPEHRTFSFFAPAVIDAPKYQLPTLTIVGPMFAGMAIGLAQRAVDEVLGLLPTRVGPPTFEPASLDPVNQARVGASIAAVRGALESCRGVFARYDARVAAGEDLRDLSLQERAEVHQQVVWAGGVCRQAVDELFRLGGANSIYEPGVLQRTWRDVNVLCQHVYLRETNHTIAGKLAFGLDVVAPLL